LATIYENLLKKIRDKTCRVGIIGMGYVGLPTMVAVANAGFRVAGIDTDGERVHHLNHGESYINDVPDDTLKSLIDANLISATSDYSETHDLDVILICVPTPITKYKEPDVGPLSSAIHEFSQHARRGQLVVLQSTTYPGTTEEFVLPVLEKSGMKVGQDFNLAFALERVDPGNQRFDVQNVPKVVGGITDECTSIAALFLSEIVEEVVQVSSPRIAEMSKLLENTFRSVNIALVNELAILCRRMNIDVWEVIQAASSKPFGFMPFYPGPGVGGHCIPVDPFYLAWKAREYDFYVNFIELAAETNDNMPYHTLSLITESLSKARKPLNGSQILVLGVTFKENINDSRNSPAIRVMELLIQQGAMVSYQDDYVPTLNVCDLDMESVNLNQCVFANYDAVIILSGHAYFDWSVIVDSSDLVIDTRNVTNLLGRRPNVVKL